MTDRQSRVRRLWRSARLVAIVGALALIGAIGWLALDPLGLGNEESRADTATTVMTVVPVPPLSSPPPLDPAPAEPGTTPQTSTPEPPSPAGLTWSVTPEVVQVGERWTFTGSGFEPVEWVSLEASGMFFGFDTADAGGNVQYISAPVDASFCSVSPLSLGVVRATSGGDSQVLGTVTVRFCA